MPSGIIRAHEQFLAQEGSKWPEASGFVSVYRFRLLGSCCRAGAMVATHPFDP